MKLTLTDINAFRDLAISLESSSPFEAYVLYRMVLRHRPHAPVVLDRIRHLDARVRKDWVVALRGDGLCERLNAIICGYFLASVHDLEFRFLWPDLSYLRQRFQIDFAQGHSVPETTAQLLSTQLITNHQIEENLLLTPMGGWVDANQLVRPFILDDFDKLNNEASISRPCWLAPWRYSHELVDAVGQKAFQTFFRDTLFSNKIKSHLQKIDDLGLLDARVALHVRGGDVVYNDARHTHTFGRVKTLSLAVAEALCDHFTSLGKTVLLFGATQNDLELLAHNRPGVLIVNELGLGEADHTAEVIRDVWLMSSCEKIVSAEDTGVTKLASAVGRAELVPYADVFPPAEEYQLSLELVNSGRNKEFHVLQQAFIHHAMFVTAPPEVTLPMLLRHVEDAHACDPENVQYLVLCLVLAYAVQDRTKAETYSVGLSDVLSVPKEIVFNDLRLRRRYLRVADRSFQRALDAVADDDSVPRFIRKLPRLNE